MNSSLELLALQLPQACSVHPYLCLLQIHAAISASIGSDQVCMSMHGLIDADIQVTCLPPCHLQRQRSHTAVLHRFVQLRNTAPALSILEDHKTDKLRRRCHTLPSLRYSGGMLFPFCRGTTSTQLRKHAGWSSAKLHVPARQERFTLGNAVQHFTSKLFVRIPTWMATCMLLCQCVNSGLLRHFKAGGHSCNFQTLLGHVGTSQCTTNSFWGCAVTGLVS